MVADPDHSSAGHILVVGSGSASKVVGEEKGTLDSGPDFALDPVHHTAKRSEGGEEERHTPVPDPAPVRGEVVQASSPSSAVVVG